MKQKTKPVFLLCLIVFILVLGAATVAPILAPYASSMGATGLWTGLLFSGFYVVRITLGIPAGRIGDLKGPKKVLTCSLLLYPIVAIAYWLADNLCILLMARMLHGVASVMMLPMAMTYMGNISPKGKEAEYLGYYNTSLYIASGIGPLVGGYLADRYNISYVFFCLFVLSIISLAAIFFLPDISANPERDNKPIKTNNKGFVAAVKNKFSYRPGIIALASINIMIAILSIFLVSFFVIFLKSKNIGYFPIGLIIGLESIICGAMQYPFGKLADKWNKFFLILTPSILIILILCLIPVISSFLLMVALMILLSLSLAMIVAASSGLSAVLGKTNGMGNVMGLLGVATSFGMIVGPLISGIILDTSTMAMMFYTIGFIWLVCLSSFTVLWGWHNNKFTKGALFKGLQKTH